MTVIQHCPTIDTSIETDVYDNKAFLGSSWRSKLMEALVRFHYRSYSKTHYKHKQAWGLKVTDLLTYPKGSLAFELGCFLSKNDYKLIPKFENHDVFHVMLDYKPMVSDEICMQFCLAGSGRRTLSTFATMIIGALFYPEYIKHFIQAYRRGLTLNNFSYQEFKLVLEKPLKDLKREISKVRR